MWKFLEPPLSQVRIWLTPIISAILAVVIGGYLVLHFADKASILKFEAATSFQSPCTKSELGQQCAAIVAGGINHAIFLLIIIVLSIGALLHFLRLLSDVPTANAGGLIVGGSFSFLIVIVVLGIWLLTGDPLYRGLGELLKTQLTDAMGPKLILGFPYVEASAYLSLAFLAVGAGSVCASCAVILLNERLHNFPAAAMANHPARAEALRVDIEELRNAITIGAAILLAGVLSLSAYFKWASPMLAVVEKGAISPYTTVTDGIVSLHGATYTVALVILFYGSIAQLRKIAVKIASDAGNTTAAARQAFLSENKLVFDAPAIFKDTLRVAAPILGAWAATLPASLFPG